MAIKSVSAWPHTRPDIGTMIQWTSDKLKALGVQVEIVDIGTEKLPNGQDLPLPNVILGSLGNVSYNTLHFIFS